jgi:hypothetical protein
MAGSRIHPLAVHAPDWLRRLLTRPRLYDRLIGILTALICSVVIALGYNLFIEPALLAFYHSIIVGLQGTQLAGKAHPAVPGWSTLFERRRTRY